MFRFFGELIGLIEKKNFKYNDFMLFDEEVFIFYDF